MFCLFFNFSPQDLNQLAGLVRADLPKLIRDIIINLITVDVHARDTITTLVENKVTSRYCTENKLKIFYDVE